MTIRIDDAIILYVTDQKYAVELFNTVNNNRAHLSTFLPWVSNMQGIEDATNYLKNCEISQKDNKEISFVIFYKNELVGRLGIHYINSQNKSGAIGYWLASHAEGKGIVLKACKGLLKYGFEKLNLNRIEIKAATKNLKSQAIPQKLNFTLEGTLRQAELVNGEYLDLNIFSMLKSEWENTISR